jgi:hypothetical protein
MLSHLLIEREKERERKKQPGGFISQEKHTMLAVPCQNFLAVRCN